MTFIKRHLSEEELSSIDFALSGVEVRRVPPVKWDWAVDDTNGFFFTQLISNTYEMRDGDYWYLLKIQNDSYVLKVDPYGGTYAANQMHLKARIEQGNPQDEQQRIEMRRIASDAMQCLSDDQERLAF